MIRVRVSRVKKYYRQRLVLEVDAGFSSGLCALLGPNGSGKSTLLRLLALVETPERGEIIYSDHGRNLRHDLALARRIVLVPDRKGLFNDTVSNNVAYGLKVRKVPKGSRHRKVEDVLQEVGLWELRQANALGLSTGEAQRLCLAMALAVDPEIILLDEPTSSLDPYNVTMVEAIIARMKARKLLIVMVTHNVFQARRLADQVILLLQGKIVEAADNKSFFENPASPITRKFLNGEMVY